MLLCCQPAEATHSFHKSEADWGFADFIQLADLQRDFLRKDEKLTFKVKIIVNTLESSCYDSKKETGYVGLRNQGGAPAAGFVVEAVCSRSDPILRTQPGDVANCLMRRCRRHLLPEQLASDAVQHQLLSGGEGCLSFPRRTMIRYLSLATWRNIVHVLQTGGVSHSDDRGG